MKGTCWLLACGRANTVKNVVADSVFTGARHRPIPISYGLCLVALVSSHGRHPILFRRCRSPQHVATRLRGSIAIWNETHHIAARRVVYTRSTVVHAVHYNRRSPVQRAARL